jgi:hypothetical protein
LFVEGGWIWSEQLEAEELAAGRGIVGGMGRVGAPLDEEREQAVCVVFQIESFPVQNAAVRAFARTGSGSFSTDSCPGEVACEHLNVTGMSGPSDEARFAKFLEDRWKF